MINIRMICRIMGALFGIEAGFLLLCALLSFYYGENDMASFLISASITATAGIIFALFGKNAERSLNRRDGYIVVSTAWVFFSFFGMLPYYISGYIPDFTNAFFETISGFTTTGASILNNIEALPHGLLFWRSLTQWIGGMGIVFFTIAILPIFGVGGVQLFAAEATGPTHDKVHPRIGVTAKWIWSIYLGLTLVETILLYAGGMDVFDSICHSLTTTSTGGYSTKQASIAAFNSAYIEYVITVFMFLSGINFTLLYALLIKRNGSKLFNDTEFNWYAGLVTIFTVLITIGLFITTEMGMEEAFRKAVFQVVSIQTSTGFASEDYMLWTPPLWMLLTIVMYFGACAGSTSGGMKCVRIAIMSRIAKNEFKHILHPNAILPVRINKHVISSTTKSTVLAFLSVYIIIVFAGWVILMLVGLDFEDAYGVVVSSLSNIGPAIGNYGPAYSWESLPDVAKWFSALLMLIGRLELFTILLLFTPGFWKKQ